MLLAMPLSRGLYAIVDVELTAKAGFEVLAFADALLDARPAALQLRAKHLGGREHLGLLEAIVRRAEATGVPIFANDRPDLAILAGADGVHVGQSDVSVDDVRRLAPRLQVGLSTANLQQVEQGLSSPIDYIAVGPVFPTNSKLDADPAVGMNFLSVASSLAKTRGIPLVAIGGIAADRAPQVAALADLGAAISALIPPARSLGTVATLARSLHVALGGK